jgi:TonB family protein
LRKAQREVLSLKNQLIDFKKAVDAEFDSQLSPRDEFEKTSEFLARKEMHEENKAKRLEMLSAPLLARIAQLENGRYPLAGLQLTIVSYDADAEVFCVGTAEGTKYRSFIEPSKARVLKANLSRARIESSFILTGSMSSTIMVTTEGSTHRFISGEVYRVGNGVSAPSVLSKVEPEMSKEARNARVEGTVVLYIEVDGNGMPQNLRVIRSPGFGLGEKAIEAVSKWKFRAGLKGGKPVTMAATVEVNFRLIYD